MTFRAQSRTVVISILGFKLFDCVEYHSEFRAIEVSRHTPLTDRMSLHFFELPKLPEIVNADDELKLWLALFNAKTEEELKRIESLGVPIMEQAINAYYTITAQSEFRERERLWAKARHNEAAALRHARTQQTIEIAKKLLKRHRPIDEIIEDTGLTREEVERLRNDV